MKLGSKLKQLREERGIYQKELATRIGVSTAVISGYENNNRIPSRETLNKIADFYGVTTDFLLNREEETELPAYIMKIAKDLNNLPSGRKEEITEMVRGLIKLAESAEKENNRKG
jgi:transcriptional regulator with XRE-family HTH domain